MSIETREVPAMDPYDFEVACTDEGKDVAEGEIGFRIEERDGAFLVIEYRASEPTDCEVVERARTRKQAEAHVREYLAIQNEQGDEDEA